MIKYRGVDIMKIGIIIKICILLLLLIPSVQALDWIPNNIINNSIDISDGGLWRTETFYKNGLWNLLQTREKGDGQDNGVYYGYSWNGTSWVKNNTINNGLPHDTGDKYRFTSTATFQDSNGLWRSVLGINWFDNEGYSWNGTQWILNSTSINGISEGSGSYRRQTTIFNKDGLYHLIMSGYYGELWGYNWNGTQWILNSTVINGLTNEYQSNSVFSGFNFSGTYYVIKSTNTPAIVGYNWNGTSWNLDSSIVSGLSSNANPNIFRKDNKIYAIVGNSGYELVNNPTIPIILYPSNNSRHYNNSVNYTWNQSTDVDGDTITYNYQLSVLSDFATIFSQSNVSNNWTGNIATTNGITYYSRVRSYDGYEYSSWSNVTQFTENSLPSISDPNFLQPPSPTVTTNLTISLNITTDPEGDTITNHTLWYINNVLNVSYNDSLFLNYSNFSSGDSIYVKAYLRDGYENTSMTTSNEVIIGSGNSAPSLSSIVLIPNIRKYNKQVWINSSNITDSESSYIRLLTYYKLANESKVYLSNSSWYAPPTTINVSFLNPWTDSNAHYIYAQVEDSGNALGSNNLTSGEVQSTLTGDTTAPSVSTSSLSATSITVGAHITISMNTSLSNGTVSNVTVHVSRPDATEADYVMNTSNNVTWTRVYTTTSDIGSYYIEYFSMTDDSGNTGTENSVLTFVASAPPSTGGGGGGGGSTIVIVKETNGTQEILFTNITSIEGLKNLTQLGECFTSGLMLSNKCAQSSISIVDQPVNWWTWFGAYIGSLTTLFIISLKNDEKKKFAENILFFGTITWVSVVLLTFMGLNLYILNYVFNSPLPGWMFLSFTMWGGIVTLVGDYYSKIYKR